MFVESESIVWHYRSDGVSTAPPVVLLHGFAQSQNSFAPVVPMLQRDFRIIRVDLPGHGQTRLRRERNVDWPLHCTELHTAISQIDERPAHWFGYSQGGRVALMCALAQPERMRSLALLGASAGIADAAEQARRSESDLLLARNVVQRGMEWFTSYWESLPIFATQKSLPATMQALIHDERMACDPRGLALALQGYGTATMPDCAAALSQWQKPLMLAAGELDEKFAASNALLAASSQSKLLRLLAVPGCGHAAHLERPELFTRHLIEFLSAAEGQHA